MKSFIALLLLVACTAPAATPEAGRAPVKTQALPPNANGGGQYSQLLKTLSCPADQKTYGSYADTGYFKAMQWCGQNAPAGHWVYVAPNWYIWGKKTAPPSLSPAQKASARGKYRTLLAKVKSQTETVLKTLDSAETRSRAMGRALKQVEALPETQAQALLLSDKDVDDTTSEGG